MKSIITAIAIFLFGFTGKAQNNLQFNRVVLLMADSVSNCSSGCPDTILFKSFVVPANKVLKIESINYNPGNYVLFLNGSSFPRATTQIPTTYPIWLPSGTYNLYFGTFNSSNSAAGNYSYILSGIEFNVVD